MTEPAQPPAAPAPAPAPTAKSAPAYTFRGEGTGTFQKISWLTGQIISRVLSMIVFRLHVDGLATLPKTGGVLMFTNHQSFLDPWLIAIFPTRQMHYMARDTLFKGGFLHYLLELWNVFPVRRGSADLSAIRNAVDRLDRGFLLNIFPEGTRSEDGSIQPIAGGIALVLNRVKSDIPIVPTIIDGAYNAWPRNARFPRPRPIRIVYGKPIPAAEWRALSPDELAWRIRRELVEAQERIGSPHASASRARYAADLAQAAAQPARSKRRR